MFTHLKRIKRKLTFHIKQFIFSHPTIRQPIHRAATFLRRIKYTLLGYPQTKKKNRRNPDAQFPRILVSGRNCCSNLCMARALGQAGYEVEILRVFQMKPKFTSVIKKMRPEAYSKYVKAYNLCMYNGHDFRLVKKLKHLADPNRKMLLVPVDDLVANVIDNHYDELSEYYILPNVAGKQGELARMMSKEAQKELARAAGLPILNSCLIRTCEGAFEIPDSVQYPCFIKPNISKNGSKTKMKRCDSKEELTEALTTLSSKKDVEILVEDFVDIGREYSLLGLSTKDGVVAPGFFGAEEGGHGAHRGVALTGEVLPAGKRQELIDSMIRFVASLDFTGLFDIDMIETKDGKMYFVELNLRFGGSGYAITSSGVNLPGMLADYILKGKPIDMNCRVTQTGKHFISERILIDEYAGNYINREDIDRFMNAADIHFIQDENDPAPYEHFKKYYFFAGIKHHRNARKGESVPAPDPEPENTPAKSKASLDAQSPAELDFDFDDVMQDVLDSRK